MYDIGENDRIFTELIEKKKREKKEKKQQKKYRRQQNTQNLINLINQIKNNVNELKAQGELSPDKMQFTGKMTDIAGVDGMKCSDVKNYIPNQDVYQATQKNILNARDAGYISIDENNVMHLTDKGRELTQSDSFIKQFEQDQLNAYRDSMQTQNPTEQVAYCEFTGTDQDMGVFNYAEQVDIDSIKDSPQKETVLNNFSELEKQGMVNISDGVITPTEKGLEFSSSQKFSVKSASNAELKNVLGDVDADGIPNRIDSTYSYLDPSSTAQAGKVGSTSIGGVSKGAAASSSASAGATSQAAAGAVTKTAGSVGVRAAGGAATKGATTAGAGAATCGVGAVVVVAAQVLTKAVSQVANTLKQTLNNTTNN